MNKPPTVMWTNELVLYQLRMSCIITEEQLANIENQYLSKKYCSWLHCMCEEVLNPLPAAVTKTFIFINDSPCTLLFFVGCVFFRVAFVLLSQQRAVTVPNRPHYRNFLPVKSQWERWIQKLHWSQTSHWLLVFSRSLAAFHRFYHFCHFSTWSIPADSTHPY